MSGVGVGRGEEVWGPRGRRYGLYLLAAVLVGYTLASYSYNLLNVEYPVIARALNLSAVEVGEVGAIVSLASALVPSAVGHIADAYGRRTAWIVCIGASALFTGLTAAAGNFAELAVFMALAVSFGASELGVSITLINESLGPRGRGPLYSWIQAGWPLGVFGAAATFLALRGLGWQAPFLVASTLPVAALAASLRIAETGGSVDPDGSGRASVGPKRGWTSPIGWVADVPGRLRAQLARLMATWFFYSSSMVVVNFYIADFLVHFYHWSPTQTSELLVWAAGGGFFFYPLGGYLGGRYGRRRVLVLSSAATVLLSAVFVGVASNFEAASATYFFIYQVTNGLWSGVGFTYWGEGFPQEVRGRVTGLLTGWANLSSFIGGLIYTALVALLPSRPGYIWAIMGVGLASGRLLSATLSEPGDLALDTRKTNPAV